MLEKHTEAKNGVVKLKGCCLSDSHQFFICVSLIFIFIFIRVRVRILTPILNLALDSDLYSDLDFRSGELLFSIYLAIFIPFAFAFAVQKKRESRSGEKRTLIRKVKQTTIARSLLFWRVLFVAEQKL